MRGGFKWGELIWDGLKKQISPCGADQSVRGFIWICPRNCPAPLSFLIFDLNQIFNEL